MSTFKARARGLVLEAGVEREVLLDVNIDINTSGLVARLQRALSKMAEE